MSKFVLVGCGRIARKHVQAVKDIEELELVGVCDKVLEKMDAVEEMIGYDLIKFESYKDILNERGNIDFVTIATDSGTHYEIAKFFIENKINVLIEKPMTMNTVQARELIEIAENNSVVIGVVHQNRFNEPIQKLKNEVEKGTFGKIVNVTARILWNRNQNYYDQASWRGTRLSDGGTLMNQCIHNIDLLQWIISSNPKRIQAERGTFLRDIEMEDFGAALVRFENNVIGIIEGTACVYPTNLEETLSVFGEKGTVVIGGLAVNELIHWNVEGTSPELKAEKISDVYGNGHSKLYSNYVDSLNGKSKLLVDGKEGCKALYIIEKIYESSNLEPKNK